MTLPWNPQGTTALFLWPRAAILGALSGALYALWQVVLLERLGRDNELVSAIAQASAFTGAGIFYGAIVLGILRGRLQLQLWRWLFLIAACAGSYYAAVFVAVSLYEPMDHFVLFNVLSSGAAGAVGAGLFSAATMLVYRPARTWRLPVLTVLAGAVVGLALPIPLEGDLTWAWIAFFALWQAAYAGAFALGLRRG